MRWGKYFLLAAFLVSVLVWSMFQINDPDTAYYLADGRYILSHGFTNDCPFNYASAQCQKVFVNEWGFHVITYLVYQIGQWNGLVIFQMLIDLTIFLLVFINARRKGFSFLTTTILCVLILPIAAERFMLRADLFGLLMVLLYYLFLSLSLEKKKYLIPLLLTQIIWVNAHGSFPLSFVLIGCFLIGEIVKNRTLSSQVKFLLLIIVSTLAVSFINPFGYQGFTQAFHFFFTNSSALKEYTEWKSPFDQTELAHQSVYYYIVLLIIVFILLLVNILSLRWEDIFVLLPFFYLSVNSVRNISIFAMFCAFILPRYADQIIARFKQGSWAKYSKIVLILITLIFLAKIDADIITNKLYVRDLSSRRFGVGLSEVAFPIKASQFVRDNHIPGRFLNDYDHGSYYDWALFPEYQTFIDGDTSTPERINYYKDILLGKIGYEEAVKRFNINFFLLSYACEGGGRMAVSLYGDKNYVPIYFDEQSIIFIANKPENLNLIKKYAIDFVKEQNFNPDELVSFSEKINYSTGFSNRGGFFLNISLPDIAINQLEKAVDFNPQNYVAWFNLGSLHQQLGQTNQAIKFYQKALEIRSDFIQIRNIIDELQSIPENNSDTGVSHFNMGNYYSLREQWERAAKEYEISLQMDYKTADISLNLGIAYQHLNQINKAIEQFQKYIDQLPKDDPKAIRVQGAIVQLEQQGVEEKLLNNLNGSVQPVN